MEPPPRGNTSQSRGSPRGRGRGRGLPPRGNSLDRGIPSARYVASNSPISTASSPAVSPAFSVVAGTSAASRDWNGGTQPPAPPATEVGTRHSFAPYRQSNRDNTCETYFEDYQSITFNAPWDQYSFEELRFIDVYDKKNEGLCGPGVKTVITQACSSQGEKDVFGEKASRRPSHKLLKGPAIEVRVDGDLDSWHLPKALVSHYSRRLEKACNANEDKPPISGIAFPEDSAGLFALFVEWMYHGNYTLDETALTTRHPNVDLDAQIWVLGDHLQCIEFKNFAMERLYMKYISSATPKPITISDVRYAFTQSARESKLQLLYKHLLVSRFSQRDSVEGNALQWDKVLQEHSQLRRYIMEKAMRGGPDTQDLIQLRPYYKEVEMFELKQETSMTNSIVTPAKRNADGESIKSQPMDICKADLPNDVWTTESEKR